jgi:hypothetical protein
MIWTDLRRLLARVREGDADTAHGFDADQSRSGPGHMPIKCRSDTDQKAHGHSRPPNSQMEFPMTSTRDGRSSLPRRHREMVRALTDDLGGEALGPAELALISQAAIITLKCETMQAAFLNGADIATDDLVRLSNSATRILVALGIGKRKRQPARSAKLAAKFAEYGVAPR